MAARVGLHSNTARFHLDGLVEQGLAQRTTEDREAPGRRRALYSAVPDRERVGRRSYRLLAQILASHLAAHSKQPDKAARQLIEALADIGFAPEAVTTGRKRESLFGTARSVRLLRRTADGSAQSTSA